MFNEKTGDPVEDNRTRNFNRSFRRMVRSSLHVSAKGRKRRKEILRIESEAYAWLIVGLALESLPAHERGKR